jgi:hypothetical protein
MIDHDQFNDPFPLGPVLPADPNPLGGDDPATVWRARRDLIENAVQPVINTTDYEEACADAIDYLLPQLTLVTLDQAHDLRNHYALELS